MLLAAPLFGTVVPPNVRILIAASLAIALTPIVQPLMPSVPTHWFGLVALGCHEALIGLLIGFVIQLLGLCVQMAGAFLDMQLGLGSAQLFDPMSGVSATPIAQFKFLLATVLLLLLNGHHTMIAAFVESYSSPAIATSSASGLDAIAHIITSLSLLALQIAAPAAAVATIIDCAAGLVNKAVPQSVPFLLSLPAKLIVGVLVLAIGLPALSGSVQNGMVLVFEALEKLLFGG